MMSTAQRVLSGNAGVRPGSGTLIGAAVLAIVGLAPVPAVADDWQIMNRSTTVVRPGLAFTTDPKAARIDFRAFDFSGFLLGDGSWQVSSPVTHAGLVCGTYEVGVRFGIGSPGCTDVRWLSEPMFIGSRRQCNAPTVDHVGGETTPRLGSQLPGITCVEREVRCTGNCK
jgi:hypothetical protein